MRFFKRHRSNNPELKKDQRGIIQRYIREKDNWDLHLEKTKHFITKHLPANPNESIAVLGSGWLLDIPVDYLSKNFKKVYLVDIAHPKQVVHKCRNYPNIEFVIYDLTGGWANSIRTIHNNDNLYHQKFTPSLPFDTHKVISANLLNQLDRLIIDQLENKQDISSAAINYARNQIQQSHIDLLEKYHSVLITDAIEMQIDKNGDITKKMELIHCKLPQSMETWHWKFDTHFRYLPKHNVTFQVEALLIN